MRKFYFQAILIAIILLYFSSVQIHGQNTGDFRSNSSGDWDVESSWQVYDISTWKSAVTGQIPNSTSNVTIQNGHFIVLKSTSECKTLDVHSGGTLSIAGKSFYSYGNVNIDGRMKGSNLPNSSAGSWYIRGENPVVKIDGILGGTENGNDGEGINIFMYHSSGTKLIFQGNGIVNISALLVKSASANNYIADIDIDMKLKNSYSSLPALSLQHLTSGINSERIINILSNKKVTITDPNGCFHALNSLGVNNSGGKMLYNIFGTLDVSAGKFNLSSNTISTSNHLQVNVLSAGKLILGNTVNLNTNLLGQTAPSIQIYSGSKLEFKGTHPPFISCTAVDGANLPFFPWNNLDKLSLDFTGIFKTNQDIDCKLLNVGLLSQLFIQSHNKLTVSDSLINHGQIQLFSDSTNTATLLSPTIILGSGDYMMNQYLTKARNWYISSPLSDATVPSINRYYAYDEQVAQWVNISPGTIFSPGSGYIVQTENYDSFVFAGKKINNKGINTSLTRTIGNGYSGFNLIGNPFPCFMNISQITSNDEIESTIWFRTMKNNRYVFDTYNIASGIANSNSGLAVNQWIPPMQAFWVRVKNGKSNVTLNMENFSRSHSNNENNLFRMNKSNEIPTIHVKLSDGKYKDGCVIYFHPDASSEVDQFDSFKMEEENSYPKIFTTLSQSHFVINGLNQINYEILNEKKIQDIQLGMKCEKGKSHFIQIDLKNFAADNKIHLFLVDNQLKTESLITDQFTYAFDSNTEQIADRFIIRLKAPGLVTDVQKTTSIQTTTKRFDFKNNQIIIVSNQNGNKFLFDLNGKLIDNYTFLPK